MAFWFYMVAVTLLIPVIMFGFGLFFSKRAPKTINPVFGYRTRRSMQNKDTWEFAHKYCGRLWRRIGGITIPVSIVLLLPVLGKDVDTIGTVGGIITAVQLILLIGSIFPTERALKRTFDEEGNRRIER